MSNSTIRYIDINNTFSENTYDNHKSTEIEKYIAHIMEEGKKTSTFEILGNKACKVYFDIENIPVEQDVIIFDIVKSLITELINKTDLDLEIHHISYLITENKHSSSHPGRSYHVVLYNVVMFKPLIRDFLCYYIANKFIGFQYIDTSVYSTNRLFRAVNQKGISKTGGDLVEDDVHKIFAYYDADTRDIKGLEEINLIRHSVIQYYKDTQVYNPKLNISLYEKRANMKAAKKCMANRFSNGGNRAPIVKNTFIFNGNITKDAAEVIENVIPKLKTPEERREEDNKVREERAYNTLYVLRELLLITNPKEEMLTLLNELIDYYKDNGSYANYKMNIQQIETMTKIIEAKITI